MKVYLVVWSECDSGHANKGAFLSKEKADALALRLNVDALQLAVESHEQWRREAIERGPVNGRYGPYASKAALTNSLNYFHTEYYFNHIVEELEVEESK